MRQYVGYFLAGFGAGFLTDNWYERIGLAIVIVGIGLIINERSN